MSNSKPQSNEKPNSDGDKVYHRRFNRKPVMGPDGMVVYVPANCEFKSNISEISKIIEKYLGPDKN